MSNNQKNDRREAQRLIISGSALISISIILALFLGIMGCSGGSKLNPADPSSSKVKKGDISQDNANSTSNGLLTNGTNSREGEFGSGGTVTPAKMAVIRQLVASGKHFGDSALTRHISFGVFDAADSRPIEGAYVAIGDGSKFIGVTDADGFCTIQNVVPLGPSAAVNKVVATAGARGYELVTYPEVRSSVAVFLLNRLTPRVPYSGFVAGTFDFGVDDFLCNVYASNVLDYIDGIMEPSGSGDTDDTYSLQVKAKTDSIVGFARRNPDNQDIGNFFYRTFNIADGETLTIDRSRENGLEWLDYASRMTPFIGRFSLLPYGSSIDSITATCYYIFDRWGALEMTDAVNYDSTASGCTLTTTYADTFVGKENPPIPIEPNPLSLEYDRVEIWVDVLYSDGAGCRFKLADSITGMESVNRKLTIPPPKISGVFEGASGDVLAPVIRWTTGTRDSNSGSMITIIDTVNGNRWIIDAPAGMLEFGLPSLSSMMSGLGLTDDNEVQIYIDVDMSSFASAASIGGSTNDGITLQRNGSMLPRIFSSTYMFTP
jgi:hypothetical protein